jgi:hypothetical protein
MGSMSLDGPLADDQVGRDGPIGFALGDARGYLTLPSGEASEGMLGCTRWRRESRAG